MAYRPGDLLGDLNIVGGEINIERYQRIARADDRCSRLGQLAGTKIRHAIRI